MSRISPSTYVTEGDIHSSPLKTLPFPPLGPEGQEVFVTVSSELWSMVPEPNSKNQSTEQDSVLVGRWGLAKSPQGRASHRRK